MTWSSLHHPNVLPLLGVTMSETRLSIVTEWMANGNVDEFVKMRPNADRLMFVCQAFKALIIFPIDGCAINPDERHCQGVSLYP